MNRSTDIIPHCHVCKEQLKVGVAVVNFKRSHSCFMQQPSTNGNRGSWKVRRSSLKKSIVAKAIQSYGITLK